MKRFYTDAINDLREGQLDEAASCIELYVSHLELERDVLINELSAAGTPRAKWFLKGMGINESN